MQNSVHEIVHKPQGSYPYMCFENRNFNYFLHFHEELEILYVEEGVTELLSQGETVPLNRGDIALIMPGEIHGLRSVSENNLWVIKIDARSFTEETDLSLLRPDRRKITPDDACYPAFAEPIFTMQHETQALEPGYEFAVRACKHMLLLALLRRLSFRKIVGRKNFSLLSEVSLYLEAHYAEKITADSTAAACHLSKYYFLHEFKKYAGVTFFSYLSVFRLEKAVTLLKIGNFKIVDIAFQCGFGNVHSFGTAFKNYFQMTPREYRALNAASTGNPSP